MELKELIQIADKAYPKGRIQRTFDGEDVGDMLATFIVRGLLDTYDLDAPVLNQLETAWLSVSKALTEIENVDRALLEAYRKGMKSNG